MSFGVAPDSRRWLKSGGPATGGGRAGQFIGKAVTQAVSGLYRRFVTPYDGASFGFDLQAWSGNDYRRGWADDLCCRGFTAYLCPRLDRGGLDRLFRRWASIKRRNGATRPSCRPR